MSVDFARAYAQGMAFGLPPARRRASGPTRPLCNVAGNADGSVPIIAAHPAHHTGASGGPSMGPLPVTGLFNQVASGLEIIYPGVTPMTPAQ